MTIFDQVNEDIKTAMKNREEGRLRALRGVKSALLLAKTEKGADDTLSDEKEMQVLQKLLKQRKESFDIYTQQNSCLLYTSPSPRDRTRSRMPSSA